jgi:hypothetical protein
MTPNKKCVVKLLGDLTRQARDIATRWPYSADDIRHGLAVGLTEDEVEACLNQAAQAAQSGVSVLDLMSMVARMKDGQAHGALAKLNLRTLPVTPIGSTRPVGEDSSMHREGLPKYPESPRGKALRDVRVARGISLREAASAVGISVVRFGELERGRRTLSEEQWDLLLRRIATLEKP